MEKSKAFFVGFLGGGIGTLVALQSDPRLWWLGLIVGGLIGYIGYDLPAAWRAFSRLFQREFRTDLQASLKKAIPTTVLMLYLSAAFMPWLLILGGLDWSEHGELVSDDVAMWLAGPLAFVCGGVSIMGTALGLNLMFDLNYASILGWDLLPLYEFARRRFKPFPARTAFDYDRPPEFTGLFAGILNPLTVGLLLPPAFALTILVGVGFVFYQFVKLGRTFFAQVVPDTFVAIHSDARVLMALSCTIGAAVGFFSGSVAIGALTGGLIGTLDIGFLRQRILTTQKQQ